MPLTITLRNCQDFSPFHAQLDRLMNAPSVDSLMLCSGYIWQPGEESNNRREPILSPDLIEAIQKACIAGKLTTVAGKFDFPPKKYDWLAYYRNFVSLLRGAGVEVGAFVAPTKNWHAKIAIAYHNREPVAAIVGSSNLTNPAYKPGCENWNFECDVTLWSESSQLNEHFRHPPPRADPFDYTAAILDPYVPKQPDETQRLKKLHDDIMGESNGLVSLDGYDPGAYK